jgi:broad specificity phosphatase PhoE
MTIYLVRHAKAGRRSAWAEPDWLRPLSIAGRQQARDLLDTLREARFAHIVSSPYIRCMETVVPLAAHHGLPIEPSEALAEGASLEGALALMKEHADRGAVLCAHGDVIPAALEHFSALGTDLGRNPRCEKGSIWVLDGDVTGTPVARYIDPT